MELRRSCAPGSHRCLRGILVRGHREARCRELLPGGSSLSLDELIGTARALVDDGYTPACQLAVARGGDLVAFETFGTADEHTRFSCFSATKPIVASLMWLLIADGAVDVARP